jgi:HPt (histidine-containing phosphotransfer) domain-containing protein
MDLFKAAEESGIDNIMYVDLLGDFISETGKDLEKLGEAVSENISQDISEIAHHIAGAALNLALRDLEKPCRRLQLEIDQLSSDDIAAEFSNIRNVFFELQSLYEEING